MKRGQIIGTYLNTHSGTLIVLGSAEGALKELDEIRGRRPNSMVAAVGHAAGFTKVDFVFSDHYEMHEYLRNLQNEFGDTHYSTHCSMCSRAASYPAVDYWWNWPRPPCTSAWTAIRFGLHVGFDEIVLCGVPMEFGQIQHPEQREKDGDVWPPPREGKRIGRQESDEVLRIFQTEFVRHCLEFKGKVFSMSGYTRAVLGAPPPASPKLKVGGMNALELRAERNRAIRRWTSEQSLELMYPKRNGLWPDSDSIELLQRYCRGKVCEIGSGDGRCSEAFTPGDYVGVDINRFAIKKAKREKPRYRFKAIGWDDKYPDADTYLFYTVLLHIPDADVFSVLARASKNKRATRMVIFEAMDSALRNGNLGNYQRNPDVYRKTLKAVGWKIVELHELPSKAPPFVRHFLIAEREVSIDE